MKTTVSISNNAGISFVRMRDATEEFKDKIKELSEVATTVALRVDALLELDRDNMDLGKGFTKESLTDARKRSKLIYKAIAKIDKETGALLLKAIDG